MTCLINGASGFIGHHLRKHLQKSGHSCICVSRQAQNSPELRTCWKTRTSILMHREDIRTDCIIHLEVKQHVHRPSADDLLQFHATNVEGTREWLDWASQNNVRNFVYFSSIKAVGTSEVLQDEDHDRPPRSPYGESKRAAEDLVRAWVSQSTQRSALILRPAVVYGPGNRANMLSLVEAIYRRRFLLIGANDNIKSVVSVRNLIAAVEHLIGLNLPGSHIFYITDPESYSVAGIASTIAELLHRKQRFRRLPLRAAIIMAYMGDCVARFMGDFPFTSDRLEALTETTHFSCRKLRQSGFVHPQTTREGLAEMVSWYLDSGPNRARAK